MEIMRYAGELKSPQTYFHDLPDGKVDSEMVSLATEIIKRKSDKFRPQDFKDRYAVALNSLVKEKSKGKKIVSVPEAETPSRGNVINLMDALRKSLKGAEEPAERKSAPKKKLEQNKLESFALLIECGSGCG